MKNTKSKSEGVVHSSAVEKLWFIQFGQVRRHSRVLYLPLDTTTVRLHRIKKGDIIKYQLLELRRAPEENAPLAKDQGELE